MKECSQWEPDVETTPILVRQQQPESGIPARPPNEGADNEAVAFQHTGGQVRSSPTASVGVVSVATNIYLSYWKEMARSADAKLGPGRSLTLHVFTDQPVDALSFQPGLKRAKIVAHKVPSFGWPEATLLRYKMFSEAADYLSQDLLMHLDADMLVVRDVDLDFAFADSSERMLLVAHPGFWRPPARSKKIKLYAANPNLAMRDIKRMVATGGLGTWEERPESTAYVPRHLRKTYVCGGTWMGTRGQFHQTLDELATCVDFDLERGIVAVWHDESHLNRWASYNPHQLLSPAYCYAQGRKHLSGISELIRAVDKHEEKTR